MSYSQITDSPSFPPSLISYTVSVDINPHEKKERSTLSPSSSSDLGGWPAGGGGGGSIGSGGRAAASALTGSIPV